MFILRHKKIFFTLSILLVLASLTGIITRGFNWGIDFTGGSVVEIEYTNIVPTFEQVDATVKTQLPQASVQKIGDKGFLIRTSELSQTDKDTFLSSIKNPLSPIF